jgi:hypothetical protein
MKHTSGQSPKEFTMHRHQLLTFNVPYFVGFKPTATINQPAAQGEDNFNS